MSKGTPIRELCNAEPGSLQILSSKPFLHASLSFAWHGDRTVDVGGGIQGSVCSSAIPACPFPSEQRLPPLPLSSHIYRIIHQSSKDISDTWSNGMTLATDDDSYVRQGPLHFPLLPSSDPHYGAVPTSPSKPKRQDSLLSAANNSIRTPGLCLLVSHDCEKSAFESQRISIFFVFDALMEDWGPFEMFAGVETCRGWRRGGFLHDCTQQRGHRKSEP